MSSTCIHGNIASIYVYTYTAFSIGIVCLIKQQQSTNVTACDIYVNVGGVSSNSYNALKPAVIKALKHLLLTSCQVPFVL